MKLKKAQKEAVLQWVAEGLETDEINARAAKFKPKFNVSRSQVDFYRKSRDAKLSEIKEAGEMDALKSGLALKSNRVVVLQQLAKKFQADLLPTDEKETSKIWLDNKKAVGFAVYDYKVFNKAEVDALRDVLDDIATEVGERIHRQDLTTDGQPLNVLSPEQIVERINQFIKLANERKKNKGKNAG